MNFIEFNKKFQNDQDVIHYFIKIRYNKKVKCNHCGSDKVSNRKERPKFFQYNVCLI